MRRVLVLSAICWLAAGCRPAPESYRGAGLDVAPLAAADVAAVYAAALGGAFSVGDPSLSILIDTLLLPRTAGLQGGTRMDDAVLKAMRDAGLVKGICAIPIRA